jgi:outer membrane lipoprotein-sorting protein
MGRFLAALFLLVLGDSGLGAQEPGADAAAKAALRKLCERFKELRSLSARIVQTRRTDLLDKPIVSSGRMYYRRDPAHLVFQLSDPRKALIHLDRTSYQVYRPDEKRLERIDFSGEEVSGTILMVFDPKLEAIEKHFSIRGAGSRDGRIEVSLEPSEENARKRLKKLVLTIAESDAALTAIATTDAEGDDLRFDLSEVALNEELAAGIFDLQVPEGTRVLRRTVTPDKGLR